MLHIYIYDISSLRVKFLLCTLLHTVNSYSEICRHVFNFIRSVLLTDTPHLIFSKIIVLCIYQYLIFMYSTGKTKDSEVNCKNHSAHLMYSYFLVTFIATPIQGLLAVHFLQLLKLIPYLRMQEPTVHIAALWEESAHLLSSSSCWCRGSCYWNILTWFINNLSIISIISINIIIIITNSSSSSIVVPGYLAWKTLLFVHIYPELS